MSQINTRIVLRNDTKVHWEDVKNETKLLVGEIGIETDTGLFKIGKEKSSGVLCTWAELDYANKIPDIDLTEVTNSVQIEATLVALDDGKAVGDIGIVKAPLYEGATTYSYTAYVWNGTDWEAMDGNYDATNVYFKEDITLAGDYTQVGNITKTATEAKTLAAQGKSLADVLASIFTKTLYPSKPSPSVSMSLTNAGSYEVGSSVTPNFTVTFDPKTYTYGSVMDNTDDSVTGAIPATNSTISISGGTNATLTAEVGQTVNSNKKFTGTATDAAFTVVDTTNYYGTTVTVNYSAGNVPVNNLDQGPDQDTEGAAILEAARVSAGTATNGTDTSKITGFRYSFKYAGTDNTSAINDAWIRSFARTSDGEVNTAYAVQNAAIGSIAVAEGAKRVMFAVPGTKTLKSVIDVDGMGLDIKDKFTKLTDIQISGKVANQNQTAYTIWYFENDNGFSKTTMNVTFN